VMLHPYTVSTHESCQAAPPTAWEGGQVEQRLHTTPSPTIHSEGWFIRLAKRGVHH